MSRSRISGSSLIRLEESALHLDSHLQRESSLDSKRASFFRFINQLGRPPESDRFRSYFLQFVPWLLPLTSGLMDSDWDPEELAGWMESISSFKHFAPNHRAAVAEAENKIRMAAIVHALYAGDIPRASAFMGIAPAEPPSAPVSRLAAAQALAQSAPAELADELTAALDKWTEVGRASSASSLTIALVDDSPLLEANIPHGRLISLHADARERAADAEEDRLIINNQLHFGEHGLYWTIIDGMLAARRHMDPGVAEDYYSCSYSIPEKSAEVSGTSLGLASSLLAWVVTSNRHYRMEARRLAANMAVTGGIRPDGAISAVDSLSLAAKIRAVFFSPLERLFLPAANMTEAWRLLGELEARYPNRHLLLQPIETLEQALQDRNLVDGSRPSPPARALAAIRRSRHKPLIAGLAAAAALALLLALAPDLRWWRDRIPARVEIAGEELIVQNRESQKLWSRQMGFLLTPRTYEQPGDNAVVFDDLDDDGTKEVLIDIRETAYPERSGILYGFDHRGRELWPPIKLGQALEKMNGEKIEDCFYSGPIVTVRINPGQPKMILCSAGSYTDHAARLVLIDHHGKVRGSYWNSGHIPVYMAHDIDGDGRCEVIAGFHGNEEGRARLAVFNPEEMWGASPQSVPNYILAGIPRARHLKLYRFPASPFWEPGSYRDALTQIELFGDYLRVSIANHGMLKNESVSIKQLGMYWYSFSSSMEPIAFGDPPDRFLWRFRDIFGRDFGPADRARLEVIDEWDGKNWKPLVIGVK